MINPPKECFLQARELAKFTFQAFTAAVTQTTLKGSLRSLRLYKLQADK